VPFAVAWRRDPGSASLTFIPDPFFFTFFVLGWNSFPPCLPLPLCSSWVPDVVFFWVFAFHLFSKLLVFVRDRTPFPPSPWSFPPWLFLFQGAFSTPRFFLPALTVYVPGPFHASIASPRVPPRTFFPPRVFIVTHFCQHVLGQHTRVIPFVHGWFMAFPSNGFLFSPRGKGRMACVSRHPDLTTFRFSLFPLDPLSPPKKSAPKIVTNDSLPSCSRIPPDPFLSPPPLPSLLPLASLKGVDLRLLWRARGEHPVPHEIVFFLLLEAAIQFPLFFFPLRFLCPPSLSYTDRRPAAPFLFSLSWHFIYSFRPPPVECAFFTSAAYDSPISAATAAFFPPVPFPVALFFPCIFSILFPSPRLPVCVFAAPPFFFEHPGRCFFKV